MMPMFQRLIPLGLLVQVLVDYPDIVRGQMNLKRLQLTDLKIEIPRVPKKKTLAEALEAAGKKAVPSLFWVIFIFL